MAITQLMNAYDENGEYSALWKDSSELLNLELRLKMEEGYWESLEGARVSVLTGDIERVYVSQHRLSIPLKGLVLQEGIWLNALMSAQVRDAKAISALEEKAGDPLKPWIKIFTELADLQEITNVDDVLKSSVSDQFVDGTLVLGRSCGLCVEKMVPVALEKARLSPIKIGIAAAPTRMGICQSKADSLFEDLDALRAEYPSG